MLGFLLARAGVRATVLEKHKDFFRDFRGDTIHPSTLELMYELGLLEDFLRVPHQEVHEIQAHFGDRVIHLADFSHLPTRCKFVAFMPQWDFLNFVSTHARRLPNFSLRMETEVTGLLWDGERVAGVKAHTPQGDIELRAPLVIGADGRGSVVRAQARLEVHDLGAPIDVLWFRISRHPSDPPQSFGFVGAGQFMVLLQRSDYWQCAYVIRKGTLEQRQQHGLPAFRKEIAHNAAFLRDRVDEVQSWNDVKLLTVKLDHLRTWWRPGLLCIGDSAHAMSPVGGVGINLAIQDAVATANLLAAKLRSGSVTDRDLRAVQQRRERPTRMTQRLQALLHKHFLDPIFDATEQVQPPLPARLFEKFPRLRPIPARLIGLGFRPEHVAPPESSLTPRHSS
jgi:2-polyprenyl-6-methoxyphenol hydroxylase-like FAD-dependent oxidoreductase